MASSSSPCWNTWRGVPWKGIFPSFTTTRRSTVRATSSMEWDTRITVALWAW